MTPTQRRQMSAVANLVGRRLEGAEMAHRACTEKLAALRADCHRLRLERAALTLTPYCEAGASGALEARRMGLATEIAALDLLVATVVEERAARRREIVKLLKQKCVVDATLSASIIRRRAG